MVDVVCVCGSAAFRLRADSQEGVALRVCAACKAVHLICDSAEFWEEASLTAVRCPCLRTLFELAVGFSFHEEGEVNWITVGTRCVGCGVLASPADWKVDYSPTAHLLGQT